VSPIWLPIIALGLLLLVVGGWLLFVPLRAVRDTGSLRAAADPCGSLLLTWENATRQCDEARRDADDARATAERRVADVAPARQLAMSAEKRASETCGRAAEARLAYEACVKERGSPRAAFRSR